MNRGAKEGVLVWNWLGVWSWFVLPVVSGCGEAGVEHLPGPACYSGQQVACSCGAGVEGFQVCSEAGRRVPSRFTSEVRRSNDPSTEYRRPDNEVAVNQPEKLEVWS
jgi:hypothetical protein